MAEPSAQAGEDGLGSTRVGFIGAGRLATALAWAMARAGVRVVGVASRGIAGARRLAEGLPDGGIFSKAQELVDGADLVFVAVPDDAVAAVVDSLRWRAGMGVVHCSAASELGLLEAAARQGAHVGGFHPLQSFGDAEAAVASLPGCGVTIEAAPPLQGVLQALACRLGCLPIGLPPGARALYHAGAHYVAGFVFVLLQEAVEVWNGFGVDAQSARAALLPLLKGTVAALEHGTPVGRMPGVFGRGDHAVLARHLDALAALEPHHLQIYRTLAEASIRAVAFHGSVSPGTIGRMRQMLD